MPDFNEDEVKKIYLKKKQMADSKKLTFQNHLIIFSQKVHGLILG